MRILVVGWVCCAVALGCSGRETPPPEPSPSPEPPPLEETPEEPTGELACARDADCAMETPCCACPPVPQLMTEAEAAATRERCMRVRCRGCEEDASGPEMTARCVDGACRAVSAEPTPTACASDADCTLATHCCACPPVPQAMHVADAAAMREECTMIDCAVCDEVFDGPAPTRAVCEEGACVAR